MYIPFEYISIFLALIIGVPIIWIYSEKNKVLFITIILYLAISYYAVTRYETSGIIFALTLPFVALIFFLIWIMTKGSKK